MDGNVELRDPHERSLIALLRSSPSSHSSLSSSSSSSYSSWTPGEEVILPLSSSPVRTGSEALPQEPDRPQVAENEAIRGMGLGFGFGLVSFVGQGGLEWKDVERRFDRMASWTGNATEPVVKWSGCGFCICENGKLENFIL